MNFLFKRLVPNLILILNLLSLNQSIAQKKAAEGNVVHQWHEMLFDIIEQSPGFTPPVTARSFAYINLAAYETMVPFDQDLRSLSEQIADYKVRPEFQMQLPLNDYAPEVAVNEAIFQMINYLYETTFYTSMQKVYDLKKRQDTQFKSYVSADIFERSKNFGEAIAAEIFEYSKTDGGHQSFIKSYDMNYKIDDCEACHQINYAADLENTGPMHPYWGKNRLFLKQIGKLNIAPKINFSKDSNSEFYKEAVKVNESVTKLDKYTEKFRIANYWDDGANATFTPAGHSLSILSNISKTERLDLSQTLEIFVRTSLAINDAFIICWKEKYEHNTIRPITYIKRYINPKYEPILLTPPFPEFPSGHSTQAGTFAEVLTKRFGDNYQFADQSKFGYGERRYYRSFAEAAKEVSDSRIIAGIHFSDACEQGLDLGKSVGKFYNQLILSVK